MNALTGIENLIAQPGILNAPYWCAYSDKVEDKNRIRDNYGGNGTIDESEKGLRQLCHDLSTSGCNLCFWFSDQPKPSKGGYRVNFYLPANTSPQQIAGVPYQPQDIDALVSDRLTAALDKYRKEQELLTLKDRIRELEGDLKQASQETAFDRIIGRLEPLANTLIDKYLPDMNAKQASTAAVGATTDEQAQQIAEQALTFLADGEPDFHITLQKLASLKKNNPMQYSMAKSFLK